MSIWGGLFLTGIILWFGSDLPNIDDLTHLTRRPSIEILDKNGVHIASYGDLYGKTIQAKDLPPHLIQALLAIEDRRFYDHMGVDPIGIARAFMSNLKAGRVVQGGSTITQQLAKNFLQSKKIYKHTDRSLHRKISELMLAFQIERRFTKAQILTMHLNRVYMGSGTWGIDAAALKYFDRRAQDLNLYEAALLMGLLQAPSLYSPARNQARSETRAQKVLNAMVHAGFIGEEEAVAAMAMPSSLATSARQNSGRYFADWIVDELQEVVDTQSQDLIVKTTLDLNIQRMAERQAHRVMDAYGKPRKADQMAMVSMDANGAVQAMVGGMNYQTSSYNRATQSLRQAGSTFKYFVYLAALEAGYSPETRIDDRPITFGKWTARNFRYTSTGSISLRNAFAKSVNAVAIRLAARVGIGRIVRMTRKMGIQSPIEDSFKNYTLALGTSGVNLLELTGAFGVILNDGYAVKPYGISRVYNREKACIYQNKAINDDEPLLDEDVLDEMKSLLRQVFLSGTGRLAAFGSMPLMGKSGTSNKGSLDRDLWFLAMTPKHVTGVWTGCDDEKGMVSLKNGSPSLHLWKTFNIILLQYLKDPKNPHWQDPEGHPSETTWAPLGKPGKKMGRNLQDDLAEDTEDEDEKKHHANQKSRTDRNDDGDENEEENEDDDDDEDESEGDEGDDGDNGAADEGDDGDNGAADDGDREPESTVITNPKKSRIIPGNQGTPQSESRHRGPEIMTPDRTLDKHDAGNPEDDEDDDEDSHYDDSPEDED